MAGQPFRTRAASSQAPARLPGESCKTSRAFEGALASREARASSAWGSQDVPAQILVLDDVGKLLADVLRVDDHVLLLQIGSFERVLVQESLHYRVKPASADVFGLLVDGKGKPGNRVNRVVGERQVYAFGAEQSLVLAGERVLWLGQYSFEVFDGQRLQLDSDRKAALQLGNEI